jgi:hypothetical protein
MDDAKNRLHQASMQQNACVFRLKIYRGRRCCSTAASISHQGGRQIRERERRSNGWMNMDLLLRQQAAASHLISESINYDEFFN